MDGTTNRSQGDNIDFRGYLTAFVDLLGLANRLGELKRLPAEHTSPEYQKRMGLTVIGIEMFRSSFVDYYKGEENALVERPQGLAPDDEAILDELHAKAAPVLHWMSDCVAINIPLDGRLIPTLSALNSLLGSIAGSCMTLLPAVGIPVRGGVSIGWGAALSSGEVVSSGLVQAYQMETREADAPRVLVDPQILEMVRPDPDVLGGPTSKKFLAAQRLFRRAQSFLATDVDGKPFIHFWGPGARSLYDFQDQDTPITPVRYVELMDNRIAEAWSPGALTDLKLRAKWRWLTDYWRSQRPDWVQHAEAWQARKTGASTS